MKVILLEDVRGQGKKGQLVNVSDGYANNYLLPKKLAKAATADTINTLKMAEQAKVRQTEKEKADARATADRLSAAPVKIQVRAGAGGRLFGSVTSREIAEALFEQHGVEISKHKIVLEEPIKKFGTYELKVKLYPEISGILYVVVAEKA